MDYRRWLNKERGIDDATIALWNVDCSGNCIKFIYDAGVKTRRVNDSEGRTFSFEGTSSLYYHSREFNETVIMVEGETDTLRLDQEISKHGLRNKITVVGLSGLNGWKDEYAVDFLNVKHVLVILDNDPGYRERDTADLTFRKIRDSIGRSKVRRVKLRDDVKDICEFFKSYSWESFMTLTNRSNKTFYRSLDLTRTPEPYKWMVDNWICQGDVTLLVGEPNVGKSFISMGLAIAVAEGKDNFLGEKLNAHGKVLYIDEENPEDVVFHRLTALGLTPAGMGSIHYYHRQHIRLDRGIDNLLDDALIIQPKLIVVDSLTRVHTQDENNAGAMNTLFNEGIMPLARETGAAVMVLHHTNKSESVSSYNRTRGSSDIGAAIDTGIEVRKIMEDTILGPVKALSLTHYKSRRNMYGANIKCEIADTLSGDIELRRISQQGSF